MFRSKFVKFLLPILKRQVDSSPDLYPFSVSWKIAPLYFLSWNNIYFAQKEPIKVKIFDTFEWSGQNFSNSLCQFWNEKSIPLQILHPSWISWKITPLYFSAQIIYTLLKRRPLKWKFLRLSSALVKICPIPYIIDLHSLTFRSVFYTVLVCVSLTNCNLL